MISKTFVGLLRDLGYEPRSYSGRGMYGAKCVGVVVDDPFKLGLEIGQAMEERGKGDYFNASTAQDSMGCDTIYYWPSMKWTDDCDEDYVDAGDEEEDDEE
jgi:hypothetical protein